MSQESKKILLFTTAFKPLVGGSEIAIKEIAKRLPDLLFEVITARFSHHNKKVEMLANIRIHRVGLGYKFDKYLLPLLGYLKGRELSNDKEQMPTIRCLHAYQASYGAMAIRKILIRKADSITAISNYLKNFAEHVSRRNNVILIPNGVDLSIFKRDGLEGSTLKQSLGIKEEERIVITASRLVEKNGIGILLKAFALMQEKLDLKTRLIIIGDGPLRIRLEQAVNDLSLDRKVLMLGEIDHEELPRYLSMADVFVRHSLSEGLGNAFLEAMACDLPVIATPVGGIIDFIEDGKTGLLVEVNDIENLCTKMGQVLTDIELKRKLIESGKRLVVETYGWDGIARKMGQIY
ncbi:MAG: Group 1 glycosyl transferase [Parcubacteria group bacterium GW2011_GWC1_39_29]|nr:MAG: Group 1 glycosyl transferase [Parcubacteria group bacterium GW2011_GWC1_39_29]